MKHIVLPALLAAMLAQAPAVQAASAEASIDWSSLAVTVYDLSGGLNAPQLTWVGENGYAYSYALSLGPYTYDGDYLYADDWTTPLATDALTPKASADATRDASLLMAKASAQTGTHLWSEGGYQYNVGDGAANNIGGFTVTGHGFVLITLDWSLSVQGAQYDWDDKSLAQVSISGSFSDGMFNQGSSIGGYYVESQYSGDAAHSGTFTLAVFSNGIDPISGSLSAHAYANAYAISQPVPEPETYALMLAGLGLVGWMARRRRV